MKNRGFKEVYQIKGGIVRYGKELGDSGLWEGSLYTFDARMALDFTENAKVIGKCEKCSSATKQFYNCATVTCHELILLCDSCASNDVNKSCIHDPSRSNNAEMIG